MKTWFIILFVVNINTGDIIAYTNKNHELDHKFKTELECENFIEKYYSTNIKVNTTEYIRLCSQKEY